MLAALSGCQKEEEIAGQELNPISRLEAEKLLKEWNAEKKSKLKSASTLTITEAQWQTAKVYQNLEDTISIISIPLNQRLSICFSKHLQSSGICFFEIRPDSSYLAEANGKIEAKNYTGYILLYTDKGKGLLAYHYSYGKFMGEHEVVPKRSLLKNLSEEQFIKELVIKPDVVDISSFGLEHNLYTIYLNNVIRQKIPDIISGGGGGSSSTLPPADPKPEVDTKRPLTPSEKQKVDQAKEEVDERGCGANMAYNMVNANWGNYKFVIDPNLNGKGLAAYYASSKTFGFLNENEITSKNITEEILHAAQDLIYENGTYQYSIVGSPNIEFEAKLLVEINNVVNGMCCSNAYLLQGENLIAFKEDIRGWIQNGNIDQNQYFHWLNIWYNDTDNPYYRKGIVKGDLSPMLLNKFLNEKLDCIKPVLQ